MRHRPIMATRARAMRKTMTPPEVMLWSRLRGRTEGQPVFRRQHPIGAYIVDFFCPSAGLAIEVDGACHDSEIGNQRDLERDEWLDRHGITVLRVSAAAVYRNPGGVADAIISQAEEMRRVRLGV